MFTLQGFFSFSCPPTFFFSSCQRNHHFQFNALHRQVWKPISSLQYKYVLWQTHQCVHLDSTRALYCTPSSSSLLTFVILYVYIYIYCTCFSFSMCVLRAAAWECNVQLFWSFTFACLVSMWAARQEGKNLYIWIACELKGKQKSTHKTERVQ